MPKLEFELSVLPKLVCNETQKILQRSFYLDEFKSLASLFNVDTEIPEAHEEALFEHILQLAKGILSTRKYQVFKKVWAGLDLKDVCIMAFLGLDDLSRRIFQSAAI